MNITVAAADLIAVEAPPRGDHHGHYSIHLSIPRPPEAGNNALDAYRTVRVSLTPDGVHIEYDAEKMDRIDKDDTPRGDVITLRPRWRPEP